MMIKRFIKGLILFSFILSSHLRFLIQSVSQKDAESMSPPIQIEVTMSSIPRALEIPKPAIITTVQTGQTASAGVGKIKINKGTSKKENTFFIPFNLTKIFASFKSPWVLTNKDYEYIFIIDRCKELF